MINIGIKDYKKRSSKTHSFDSNILAGFAMNGSKGMKGKLKQSISITYTKKEQEKNVLFCTFVNDVKQNFI